MTNFTPALLEPWQLKIAALYEKLAIDIAAIYAAAATTTKESHEK